MLEASGPHRAAPEPGSVKALSFARLSRLSGDFSGAFADLGTFLPLVLGVMAVNQFNPASVLFGFGCFALATAVLYRRPVPVQPMKAVAAIIIASGLSAQSASAAGIVLGCCLVLLAFSGAVERLKAAIPQSVLAGVSLGIGLHLAVAGLQLVSGGWVAGLAMLVLVLALSQTPARTFACLIGLALAAAWGVASARTLPAIAPGLYLPEFVVPSWTAFREAGETVVIPQLMLTIANAVLATAALAATYFPADAERNITPRRLALSTGVLNLALAPLGAIPMCHGAGGLVAQHRFGARTGLAPAIFGITCLALGLFLGNGALAVLGILPLATVGALLVIAGGEMAANKRLFDGKPDCLAVILVTGLTCVLVNIAVGVVAGLAAEFIRSQLVRLRNRG